jgi:uncharacterized protein YecE (DUF72 family)
VTSAVRSRPRSPREAGPDPKGLPAARWLEHYATLFDTVEINNTFYRLPARSAVAGWVQRSPRDFLFSVKVSRYITHLKRLTDLGPGLDRFYDRIEPLLRSPKMGPLLWQLPGNFHRNDERLASALDALPPGRHCFEFRHASWFAEPIYELLRLRGVALVIGDTPSRPFQTHELTAGWTFIRFHGGWRGRRGNYSDSELAEWQDRITEWRKRVDVYAYFNNDWEGFAVKNALRLRKGLEEGGG